MTDDFLAAFQRRYDVGRAETLRVLREHPGKCTVIYWVYGFSNTKDFATPDPSE